MEYHFKDIKKNLLNAIGGAEFIIYCAVAWITDFDIINALIAKSKEGVKIELVVNDDDTFSAKKKYFQPFIEAGGKLYLYPKGEGIMHNKFCVIDLNTIITGSFNWTYSAATMHEENIIIESNNIIMSKDFSRQFKKLKQSSIVFQDIQQAANNDIAKYIKVVNVTWVPQSTDEKHCFVIEINGVTYLQKFINGVTYNVKVDHYEGQVKLKDEEKEGFLYIRCKDEVPIPEKIFGYWGGVFFVFPSSKKKWYNFVCLDPLLIKYT